MHESRSQTPAIIREFFAYRGHPFESITPDALRAFEEAKQKVPQAHALQFARVLKTFECYLQITNQTVSIQTFTHPEFVSIYRRYVGSLFSDRLIDRTNGWKKTVIRALNSVLSRVFEGLNLPPTFPYVLTDGHDFSPAFQQCVLEFTGLPLNEEKVWLWRGWLVEARSGKRTGLPLYPIYARLGRDFTQRVFDACEIHGGGRRGNPLLSAIAHLSAFIGQYPGSISQDRFKERDFMTNFWREFLRFFMVSRYRYDEGPLVSTLAEEWKKNVIGVAREALEPAGIFAKPWGEIPTPDVARVSGSRTHIRKNASGNEVKVKLLTEVPLHVSDEEAMELLFYQIEADVKLFVKWAEWAVDDLWNRFQGRLLLAKSGKVRRKHRVGTKYNNQRWLTDRTNPEYLQNAAATLDSHGHVHGHEAQCLMPIPLEETARELGMPVTDALYPFCILLVEAHPDITPAFLETLELFDKNGNMSGYIQTDSGSQLVGKKYRRGPKLAQQFIALTDRTAGLVEQMIALTQSLRAFLRSQNNDDWRYLLLTCGRGFGFPRRVRDLSATTVEDVRIKALAESLGNTSALTIDERVELVRKFSLVALRSSVGVLIYLREGSVEAMAKALGHASVEPRLISSYLPEPILAFFQDRWIRIFQTGMIVEALKDSTFLLPATGFKNLSELDAFLCNHSLKVERLANFEESDDEPESKPGRKVVFGVNTAILTALISLRDAVEGATHQVPATARYWSEIAGRLIDHIESELNPRHDLKGYLVRARAEADPSVMGPLLYV
jgi:hypothetical protein